MAKTFYVLTNEATAAKRRIWFDLRDATDGITAETGEAGGQPQISTDGGAWTNTGIGTLSHVGNGRYTADLTQTAVNISAGSVISTRFKSANTAETPGDSVIILAYDPWAAVVPANVTQWLGSAPNSLSSGRVDATVGAMQSNVVTAAAIATDAIDADAIADNAINAGAIASDAITSAKIADNAITANKIANDAITAAKIATDAIDADALADNAITAATFAAGAINAAAIASNAIDADALAADVRTELRSLVTGTADSGTTTTLVDAERTESLQDFCRGQIILFTSGSNAGRTAIITAFAPGLDQITFLPAVFPSAIAAGDTYEILPHGMATLETWKRIEPDALIDGRVAATTRRTAGGSNAAGTTTTLVNTGLIGLFADDYWNGQTITFNSGSNIDQTRLIVDFDGSTGTFTFAPAVLVAIASGTSYEIGPWAAVDIQQWKEVTPNALIAGRVDANAQAMANGVITAGVIATDAIDADAIAADAIAEINTTVDAALADIRLDELIQNAASPADPTADSFIDLMTSKNAGQTFDRATDSLEALADSGGGGPTVQQIVDGVLDEAIAGHLGVGSVGEAINEASQGACDLAEIKGPGFNAATDTLEEIRDAIDANCGGGGAGVEHINIEGM